MPKKATPIPYSPLPASIMGLLVTVVACLCVACQQDAAGYPSSTSFRATTPTSAPMSRSVYLTPTAQARPTTALVTAPPVTPAPTSSPTPTPIAISPPFVSSTGALAHVQGGQLSVVSVADSTAVVVATGVTHSAQAVTWSPNGRWLLYTTATGEPEPGLAGERQRIHLWDSQLGETSDLAGVLPGFPLSVSGIEDATWSPEGTRVLFPCFSDAASCRAWVLDVTTTRSWHLPEPSITTGTWIDENTILCKRRKDDKPQLLSVAPSAQILTKTLTLSGIYALSPGREYIASLRGERGKEQRLHVLPLPGHPPLSLSDQPTVTASGPGPLWSPDGRWVTYGAKAIISSSDPGPHTILADTRGTSGTQSFDGLLPVAWSSDGRFLTAFGCSDTTCRLSVIDTASGEVANIASAGDLRLWDLAWSPRGVYMIYSLSGSNVEREGLILWTPATGEQDLLIQAGETQPLTDLQWAADGCTLYAAQREERGEEGLAVSAIWGIGPTWEDRWRIAPGVSEDPRALLEAVIPRWNNQGGQLCPSPLLAGRRLVAYYGTPSGPGLGILGRHGITETLRLLKEQTLAYRDLDPTAETIPAFHMVTTIADGFSGPDGDYNHRVPHKTIRRWIDSIEAEGGWSILDIQPGRADLVDEMTAIETLLLERNVHLAVDPEFIVGEDQVPGQDMGQITGPQINWIQARMDRAARTVGQRKILVVHQFNDRMVEQKELIRDYPLVDLVWDADGFGSPYSKIEDYHQYKGEAGFEHGGFKIFYRYDQPVMTPEQVLSLDPPPRLVIYQ